MLRRILLTLRGWVRDWLNAVAAPFRLLRPQNVRGFVSEGRSEAAALARGTAHDTFHQSLAFVWLVVRLPWLLARFLVYDGPRWVLGFVHWNSPKRVAMAVCFLLITGVALGGSGWYLIKERRQANWRNIRWRQLEFYMDHAETEKVEETLVELQKLLPNNGTVAARLDSVRGRQAPANDPPMVRLLMRAHYRDGNIDKAAREAAKLIEGNPADWEARCFLAHDAYLRGAKDEVRKHIDALPRAHDAADSIPLWSAWYSANVFQAMGETAKYEEIVDYLASHVLPLLRLKELPTYPPVVTLFVLDCFHHVARQMDRRRLTAYWVPLQQATQGVLVAESVTDKELVWLGACAEHQLAYLEGFARLGQVSTDDRTAMAADVELRLKAIWEKLLARNPKHTLAHRGLAGHLFRTGSPAAAVELLDRAIAACGPAPELIEAKTLYLRLTDPAAALALLEETLNQADMSPSACQLLADAAVRAGRPDKALLACRRARELQPGLYWAHRAEGKLCRELGRPTEAAAAFAAVRQQLTRDPEGAGWYMEALCESGAYALAEEFLTEMQAVDRPLEVMVKTARTLQRLGRHDEAVRWAVQARERDQGNVEVQWTLANSLRALAEGEDGWDRNKVLDALRAYADVRRLDPNHLGAANNIVWLELKALGQPDRAFASSELLRKAQDGPDFPADYLDTLAELALARKDYETARQLLERARERGGDRASFAIHLALAYAGLNQPEKAERSLARAAELPKSPRDQMELREAGQQIRRR